MRLEPLSVLAAGLIALPAVAQSMRFPVPTPGLAPDDVAHITAYVRNEQRKVGIQ